MTYWGSSVKKKLFRNENFTMETVTLVRKPAKKLRKASLFIIDEIPPPLLRSALSPYTAR
jgi:hypothetical protein